MVSPLSVDSDQLKNPEEESSCIPLPNNVEETETSCWHDKSLLSRIREFCTPHLDFPYNDVSCQIRMPVLGLCATLIFIYYYFLTVGYEIGTYRREGGYCIFILYIVYFILATGAACDLWWGLKTQNIQHINLWTTLKYFEIIVTILFYFYYICFRNIRDAGAHLLFYTFPVIGANLWVYHSVLKSARHLRNTTTSNSPENTSTIPS